MEHRSPEHLQRLLNDMQGELDAMRTELALVRAMSVQTRQALAVVTQVIARTDDFPRAQVAEDLRAAGSGVIKQNAPFMHQVLELAAEYIEQIDAEG